MRARSRWLTGVALGAATLLIGAGCADNSEDKASSGGKQEITIMAVGPMSGPSAAVGEDILNGAKLAAEHVNRQGGIKSGPLKGSTFKVVAGDTKATTEGAAALGARLVQESKIWTMVGFADSGMTQAAAQVAARAGLGVVSVNGCSDVLTEKLDNVAVGCPKLQSIAATAVVFAKDRGLTRVGTIANDLAYQKDYDAGVNAEAKKQGVDIVTRQVFSASGTTDFSALVENLKKANIQAVLNGGVEAEAGRILATMRRAGLNVPFIDYTAAGWGKVFQGTASKAITTGDGAFALMPGQIFFTENSLAKEIADQFQERHGKQMTAPAQYTFDGFMAVVGALEAGASNRKEIIEYIPKGKAEGIQGPIAYGEGKDLRAGHALITMAELTGDAKAPYKEAAMFDIQGTEIKAVDK